MPRRHRAPPAGRARGRVRGLAQGRAQEASGTSVAQIRVSSSTRAWPVVTSWSRIGVRMSMESSTSSWTGYCVVSRARSEATAAWASARASSGFQPSSTSVGSSVRSGV
ncbi:hypothetical protein ACFFX0_27935 [Citricoccus parietis]|uniref:Uncharacterized protein n=1 Tax=Citricoccus parietis TaxID=592307 RepID=A0ABV5G7B0_9MICC